MVAGLKVGLQLIETDAFKVFFIFSAFSNFGFQRAGAQLWEPLPLCSSLTVNSDEYLECYVRHTAGTGSSLLIAPSEIIDFDISHLQMQFTTLLAQQPLERSLTPDSECTEFRYLC